MDRNAETLAAVAIVGFAIGFLGLVSSAVVAIVFGLGLGAVSLAALRCEEWLQRSRWSPFRFGLAIVACSTGGALAVGSLVGTIVDWGGVVGFVFACGAGLAFLLGLARTYRQQSVVVVALLPLIGLFVATGIHDWTTHREMEGIATMLAVSALPIVLGLSIALYRRGATLRKNGDECTPKLVLAAAILPWIGGALALYVPKLLRTLRLFAGRDRKLLEYAVLDAGPAAGLVLVGVAFTYGVHRAVRPSAT